MTISVRRMRAGDEADVLAVGPGIFDDPLDGTATRTFLADPRHHLLLAYEDGVAVGFVSGVHYVHPDKPAPEMWLNEIGVREDHRQKGAGKDLLEAFIALARELGCSEAWVLTERDNAAAMALYAGPGGVEAETDSVMFTYVLDSLGLSG